MAKLDDLEARRERVALLRSQGSTSRQIQTALGLTVGQVKADLKLFQPQPYDDDVRKLLAENLSYKAIGERLGISIATVHFAVKRIRENPPIIRLRKFQKIPAEKKAEIRQFAMSHPDVKIRSMVRRFGIGHSTLCKIIKGYPSRYKRMRNAVKYARRYRRSGIKAIARKFNVAPEALSRRLRKLGVTRIKKRELILDAPPEWSFKQIARVVGCDLSYVHNVLKGQKRPSDVPDYLAVPTVYLDHAYELDAKEPPKEFERGIAPLRFPPIFMKQYVKVYYEARKIREEFTPEIRAVCEQIKRGELEKDAHMREYRIGQSCGFFERSYNSFWDCVEKF